eukprot:gene25076-10728_t
MATGATEGRVALGRLSLYNPSLPDGGGAAHGGDTRNRRQSGTAQPRMATGATEGRVALGRLSLYNPSLPDGGGAAHGGDTRNRRQSGTG